MSDLLRRVRSALAERYLIDEEVGRGGMAVVYRAQDLKHHRQVAIKVLLPELAGAIGSERFLREIEIVAGLNHPNILALHDSGQFDGIPFYVMPLEEGETLRDRLRAGRPLELDEAVRIAREVGDALEYAHARGVVHRDIKPENVLFQAGHALVADFGIARAISEAGGTRMTGTGLAVGTLAYMSPEQAAGESDVDARSDVYALGCLIFEMLTGQSPFAAGTPQALLARKVAGSSARLTDTRSDLPPTVDDVVQRALASEPGGRFQTVGDLTAALEYAVTTTAVEEAARRRAGVRYRRAFGGSLAVAVVVALALWGVTASQRPRFERLAVLPIANFSNAPDQAYLLEGLHQAIISELQQAGVTIIGRRGVMQYADADTSIRDICDHLGVDAVVDAWLLRSGDTLALQVGLIDGDTQTQVWSAEFTQDMSDVLNLYQDVTRSIADEIQLAMTPEAEARLARRARPVDPQAYDLVLQARFHWRKLTAEGIDAAERYLTQALAIDPDYASAWAGIAQVWGARAQQGLISTAEARPMVDSATTRALELDPSVRHPEVGFMLAVGSVWREWDFDQAAVAFEAVLDMDPEHAQAAAYFAHYLHFVDRHDDAAAMFQRALDSDPDDPLVQVLYGMELMFEGRYDFAIQRTLEALRITPNDPTALSVLKSAYHMTGQHAEAVESWRRWYEALGHTDRAEALMRGWDEGGYPAALRAVADLMEEQARQGAFVTPWQLGTLYTRAGDEERALGFLEAAVDAHDPNCPYLTVDPIFDGMREHPRFRRLLERVTGA